MGGNKNERIHRTAHLSVIFPALTPESIRYSKRCIGRSSDLFLLLSVFPQIEFAVTYCLKL